jgi:hypothetical protein
MIVFYAVVKSEKARHFSQGQAVGKSTEEAAIIKKRRHPQMPPLVYLQLGLHFGPGDPGQN